MMKTLLLLVRSRKFWVAVFGLIGVVASEVYNVPQETIAAWTAICMTLIGAIAYEDAATKSQGG